MNNTKGFTMIELIITIVVLGILGVAVAYALASGIGVFVNSLDGEKALAPMRMAMGRLQKDMREVRTLKDVATASGAQFRFRDLDYNDVNYQYSGGTLSRNSNALLTGLTSFSFAYTDSAETAIPSPAVSPNPTDIRLIDVQMTCAAGGQSRTMKTTICPRTFRD